MFRKKKQTNVARNHCKHCTGSFGRCACNFGCPAKPGVTQCSAVSKHCHHCSGGQGDCNCNHQCPAQPDSKCTAVHFGVSCGGNCIGDLKGPRFKCAICPKFDVCTQCFYDGDHDTTHNFLKIQRPGSTPINVPARGGDTDLHVAPYQRTSQPTFPQYSRQPFVPPQPMGNAPPPTSAGVMSPPASVTISQEDISCSERNSQQDEISRASVDQSTGVRSEARSRGRLPDEGNGGLPVENHRARRQRQDGLSEEGSSVIEGSRAFPGATSVPGSPQRNRNGPSDEARLAAGLSAMAGQKEMENQPTQQPSRTTTNPDELPIAEVVTADGASVATGAGETTVASHCSFNVGQVVRLQGLTKMNMNGRFGTIDAITATQKAIVRVKGHNNPVVVGSKHLVDAFPQDSVVMLPDQNPGIVLSSGNKKVCVMNTGTGEEKEYEPEELTMLEELS